MGVFNPDRPFAGPFLFAHLQGDFHGVVPGFIVKVDPDVYGVASGFVLFVAVVVQWLVTGQFHTSSFRRTNIGNSVADFQEKVQRKVQRNSQIRRFQLGSAGSAILVLPKKCKEKCKESGENERISAVFAGRGRKTKNRYNP